MAYCQNVVGVKNILITFFNCETNTKVGPIAHELATEELPSIHSYPWTFEDMPGGYVKRKHTSAKIDLTVVRNDLVPLADYQGRSQISLQLEYDDGHVYTGQDGGIRGEEMSDTHAMKLGLSFREVIEQMPNGALLQP